MSVCYACGTPLNLHIHEVFSGNADRKKSIEWGCYVALCARHHNMSDEGVHFNKQFNYQLKADTQLEFERLYGHKKFMDVFHQDYIQTYMRLYENKDIR